ncbi:hypothetical protein Z959_10090 [Clostridium novyi B str. ATCC 27606]|uniref:Uncharacterized protein n=1 Tax=Clostridium novyi B str. ATCC 27606 TaxID=1443123 RepID=A0AA40IUH8_CLONO|nr:hypothetical protein Z959_10090 [Clostridium novyi B str. ATCC 27606]
MDYQKLYNIVNTIFPIGIFILSIIYMFGSIKNELENEIFSLKLQDGDKKVFNSLVIFILVEGFGIGIALSYFLCKIEVYCTIINMIKYIYLIIICIIELACCKLIKEENILNILIGKKDRYRKIVKKSSQIITFFSGLILGCSSYLIKNDNNNKIQFLIMFIIYIIMNFILVSLCTFLKNIYNIRTVMLLDKRGQVIIVGKMLKIVDDFITIIKSNKNIKFINKNEVSSIEYVEGIDMNEEQIKEITITLIEKGMLYAGENNEETAIEIAKFINKLREETNK